MDIIQVAKLNCKIKLKSDLANKIRQTLLLHSIKLEESSLNGRIAALQAESHYVQSLAPLVEGSGHTCEMKDL